MASTSLESQKPSLLKTKTTSGETGLAAGKERKDAKTIFLSSMTESTTSTLFLKVNTNGKKGQHQYLKSPLPARIGNIHLLIGYFGLQQQTHWQNSFSIGCRAWLADQTPTPSAGAMYPTNRDHSNDHDGMIGTEIQAAMDYSSDPRRLCRASTSPTRGIIIAPPWEVVCGL